MTIVESSLKSKASWRFFTKRYRAHLLINVISHTHSLYRSRIFNSWFSHIHFVNEVNLSSSCKFYYIRSFDFFFSFFLFLSRRSWRWASRLDNELIIHLQSRNMIESSSSRRVRRKTSWRLFYENSSSSFIEIESDKRIFFHWIFCMSLNAIKDSIFEIIM